MACLRYKSYWLKLLTRDSSGEATTTAGAHKGWKIVCHSIAQKTQTEAREKLSTDERRENEVEKVPFPLSPFISVCESNQFHLK